MVFIILELLYTTLFSGFFLIGFGTVLNKLGDFFKIIEEEEKDNFKKAFDKITNDSIGEFNKCFISTHIVISRLIKLASISYDLVTGEKVIKKNKDGNIIICDKSAIMEKYESKIEALESKINKFKELAKNSANKLDLELSDEDDDEDEDKDEEDEEDEEDKNENNETEILNDDE
jgi:hypothetical protein